MRPNPECACMVSFIPLDCISLDKLSVLFSIREPVGVQDMDQKTKIMRQNLLKAKDYCYSQRGPKPNNSFCIL